MTRMNPISVLAFAPHPDDAEIFCGGTLAKLARLGHLTGIIDLTKGELSSQGNVEQRAKEAERASAVLGTAHRQNLGLPDGGLNPAAEEQLRAVVELIRSLRPELVLAPWTNGRHPDHEAAGALLTHAAFYSGVRRYEPALGEPHTPLQLLYYRLRREFRPSFVCDISEVQQAKMEAVRCFQSQVVRAAAAPQGTAAKPGPLISSPRSVATIETIDRYYGAMIGAEFGEAFYCRSPLAVADPLAYFRSSPLAAALNFPGDA